MQVTEALVADAVGILVEHETVSYSKTGLRDESGLIGSVQDATEQRAGTYGVVATVRRCELADEIGRTRLRQFAFTGHEQPVASVREPGCANP